jgi:hypothetical protein
MQNEHNNVKICTLLQNLSNMQKYAHLNLKSDIMAPRNEFISHSSIFNNNLKSMQLLDVPKSSDSK